MSERRNSDYYARRALEERRMTESATIPRTAAIHAELTARYEALASTPSLELPGLRAAR